MPDKNPHITLVVFKGLAWVLVTVLVLSVVLRLSLNTKIFRTFVKNKIISTVSDQYEGELTIGKLEGDIWKEIRFVNLVFVNADTLLVADTLSATYNVWGLLSKNIDIRELRAIDIRANLKEKEDSSFVFLVPVSPDTSHTSDFAYTISIADLMLKNGYFNISSPSFLPDTSLTIRSFNVEAALIYGKTIQASLNKLDFLVEDGRLPGPVAVNASANYEEKEINLQKLIVNTGRSLFKAEGYFLSRDSTISLTAKAAPLSFSDIQPYIEKELTNEDVNISLSVSGDAGLFNISLDLDSPAIKRMEANVDVSLKGNWVIKKAEIKGQKIDLAALTNDSLKISTGTYQVSMSGLLTQNPDAADLIWSFAVSDLEYEKYSFKSVFGNGTVNNENVNGKLEIEDYWGGRLEFTPSINRMLSEKPDWEVGVRLSALNLEHWAGNPNLKSSVNLIGSAKGEGFSPDVNPWEFSLKSSPELSKRQHKGLKIGEQTFSYFELKGTLNKHKADVTGIIRLDKSELNLYAEAQNILDDIITFSYEAGSSSLNLDELYFWDNFPTSLNFSTEGTGSWGKEKDLSLTNTFRMDSSIVNAALVKEAYSEVSLEKGILHIKDTFVNSDLIEGKVNGRKNIYDETDPENQFYIAADIKNIQPLSPVFGLQTLTAEGRLNAVITDDITNGLLCEADIDLKRINVDSLFIAEGLKGKVIGTISDINNVQLGLSITSPVISGINFQDINLSSTMEINQDTLVGDYTLNIAGSERGKVVQHGLYEINIQTQSVKIDVDKLDIITAEEVLAQQNPFQIIFENKSLRTDTLRLAAESGSYFSMAIPEMDSLVQNAWVQAQDFDFGLMQHVVFGERYIDGTIFGEFSINKNAENIISSGSVVVQNITYKGLTADTLNLDFEISEERLLAQTKLFWDAEQKITGNVDVPFALSEPDKLDDAFFRQPVSGHIEVKPFNLKKIQVLLDEMDIRETTGILNFTGNLSGTAGEPDMEGIVGLKNPVLSGISVDSVYGSVNYVHKEKQVSISGDIIAKNQKAATADITIPFSYDFKKLEITLPGNDDEIKGKFITKDFNISVFNDFLDHNYLTKLRGSLNADINVSGPSGGLRPQGYIRLDNAEVSVPISGIKLENIRSDMSFNGGGLTVNEMYARSGKGDIKVKGNINLTGIIPASVNLEVRAKNFKLANTEDQNIVIDLDAQLSGNANSPKATGKLTVKNGFVYLQNFGDKSIEKITLEDEKAPFSPYDSLNIDMQFTIQNNFFVRNRRYLDMEIELTGTLDAQKEKNKELMLFGSLEGQDGYLRPLGKQFELEETNFTFSGPMDNPNLYIKSRYIPPTPQNEGNIIELFYVVEGTAQNPEFRFESNPQMEQQDIIAYTLFGRPFYALESWQQAVSGGGNTQASDILTDVLLDELETLATRELGIDVVQIDNTQSGTESGTSIKTGWYVNERTFFALVNEITSSNPKTLYILEYLLKKNIDLIITYGDGPREGVDVRWKHDY